MHHFCHYVYHFFILTTKKPAGLLRQGFVSELLALNFGSLLIDVDRRSLGEGDAVGPVEGVEIHLTHADVEGDGGHGAQEFAPILGVKTPISSEKYLLPILGTLIQKTTDLMPLIPENISDTLVQCFKLNLMVSSRAKVGQWDSGTVRNYTIIHQKYFYI